MPAPRSPRRARLAVLVSAALAVTGFQFFVAPTAQANIAGTNIVISEVYGGGGNASATYTNDFIELYNPTSAPIDVTGWTVQYRSATGTTPQKTSLAGTMPAGAHYLVQEASQAAVGLPLPTPDASSTIAMAAGAGVVILANNSTDVTAVGDFASGSVRPANVVDAVGYGGTPTTFETTNTVTTLTSSTSAQRVATGIDTDANNPDFSEATPTPQNLASTPAPLALASINDQNSVVSTAISTLQPSASGGTTPYSWSATGLPTGLGINATTGAITGTPTATCDCNVQVTVEDSASGTHATAARSFVWHVTATVTVTPIADIQGTNVARSPFAPPTGTGQGTDTLTTRGVITALYTKGFTNGAAPAGGQQTCGFCGFYIQTAGSGGPTDLTPQASDAIFVFAGSSFIGKDKDGTDLAIGDSVEVTGKVSEFAPAGDTASTTELNATAPNIAKIASLGTVTKQPVLPATYDLREEHEGELFQPTDLVITDTFNFESFGELGLSQGRTLQQPNEACLASDTSCITAAQTDIKNRGWFTEDGTQVTFSSGANFFRPINSANSDIPLPFIDKTHSARVGAQVSFPMGGVLDFRNKKWYVQVPHRCCRRTTAPPSWAPTC